MRFAQAHKTSSYLMMLSAYLALVSGGGVSPVVGVFGLLALIGSWWWEPPRIRWETWALPWTILSVLALVWSVVQAMTTGDFLTVGSNFLVWLVVAKAFQRRAMKDWQQLYLLAFLMMVAGSVVGPDLGYGLFFLAFVVTATWALMLHHLRREMEDNFLLRHANDNESEPVEIPRILQSRRIVDRRFFAGTGVVSLGVFVAASVIFLAIPRVGMGFFFKGRAGLTMAGFSDGVRLGGHGRIKFDTTIVMRVEIDAPYQGRDAPYIHWRGVTFDTYSRGAWTRTKDAPPTRVAVDQPVPGKERRLLLYDHASATAGDIETAVAGAVRQNIWLEPLDADVLFAGAMPVAVQTDVPLVQRRSQLERNDEVRVPHHAAIRYTAWSRIEPPSPERLRKATGPLPEGYDIYTRWPRDQITGDTVTLARTITAGKTNTYDQAMALRDWLESNLTYTLDLVDPGSREPVDFFLFERRKGHCEYFASAFVILARTLGIPARNVNGFLGGEWNEYDDYIAVRAGDAHSWAEVYFPGEGWVTFDPTPAGDADPLGRGGDGVLDKVHRMFDTLRFQWSKWVVDYDLHQQLSLFRDVGATLSSSGRWIKDTAAAAKRWIAGHWPWVALLAGVAMALLVIRRRRRPPVHRDDDPPSPRQRRRRSAMASLYATVLARMARRGLARSPATTPRELAADLVARGVAGAAEMAELTELYYAAEWGGTVTPEDLERAHRLRRAIEAAMDRAGERWAQAAPSSAPPL